MYGKGTVGWVLRTFAIYLITCRPRSCRIQYVGQTKNKLLTRSQSHHFDIKHNNDTTVARHFNKCPKPTPGKFEGMEISNLRTVIVDFASRSLGNARGGALPL